MQPDNRRARCTTPAITFNSTYGGYACRGYGGSPSSDAAVGSADSHGYWPLGGYYGVASYNYCPPDSGQIWSNNVWDDNGASVGC